MAGAAGAQIAASGFQPPIGEYAEAPMEIAINAPTNYIGKNGQVAYKTNVLGQGSIATNPSIPPQPDWIVPDIGPAAVGTSQWVRAADTIAEGGTCTVADGAATAGAGTYVCNVKGGVVAGDFFWATVAADS